MEWQVWWQLLYHFFVNCAREERKRFGLRAIDFKRTTDHSIFSTHQPDSLTEEMKRIGVRAKLMQTGLRVLLGNVRSQYNKKYKMGLVCQTQRHVSTATYRIKLLHSTGNLCFQPHIDTPGRRAYWNHKYKIHRNKSAQETRSVKFL